MVLYIFMALYSNGKLNESSEEKKLLFKLSNSRIRIFCITKKDFFLVFLPLESSK
jgi:hypothetical protein